MYYIRETDAGMTREVEKWVRAPKEVRREMKRAAKRNPTAAAQEKVNRDRALRALVCLVNANFCEGDYWLTLTYAKEYAATEDGCRKDYETFMRKLRALYKKAGVLLKYIAICNEPGHRPHIHILCSKGVELQKIAKLWEYGRIGIKLLDDSGQYRKLAEYIFRHGNAQKGRSWNPSQNLERPKVKEREINARHWREQVTAPKGWMLDKTSPIERGVNPVDGTEFLRYTLIKIEKSGKCGELRTRTRDNYGELKGRR